MTNSVHLKELREKLRELSVQPLPEGTTLREFERNIILQWRDLVPDKPLGKRLYEGYTNEELIEILREAYQRLGRTPIQKDIFCFYRTYLKHRFVTWSGALRAAGLGYSLDHGGCCFSAEEYERIKSNEPEIYAMLICLSERRTELGYPPKRKEFSGNALLKDRFGSWNMALHVAEGLDQWLREKSDDRREQAFRDTGENNQLEDETYEPPLWAFLTQEDEELLDEIKKIAGRLGRTPVKKEVNEEARSRMRIRFGSWESVLYAAGITPLEGDQLTCAEWDYLQRKTAGGEVLYRIPDLEPGYILMLQELAALSSQLSRTPLKKEFDPEMRVRLQARCGSWRNVLYQIGLAALSKEEVAGIKQKIRKSQKFHLQK